MIELPARRRRRARVDLDHRVGHRHPAGQHADRRALRHLRPVAALPDPRPRRPLARARLRVPALSQRGGADARRRPTGCRRCRDYTELGSGFKIAMRDLELRGAGNLLGDEQSGHVAALGFELYMQMLDEAVRGDGGRRRRSTRTSCPSPCGSTSTSTPTCPADYIPYEQAKVEVHRRIAGAREVAELAELRRGAGRPLRRAARAAGEPDHAPAGAHQARPGRRARGHVPPGAGSRSRRSSSTPCARSSCARRSPARSTSPGKSQLSMRVPDDPAQRFPAVVRAADALLAVQREAA